MTAERCAHRTWRRQPAGSAWTTRRRRAGGRRAFSLLEIMIAIVIFGIGMVMVATVFPVGLDMTRTSMQMDLSQAVADSALGVLELKVPGRAPGTWSGITGGAARVVAPDVHKIELDESPAQIVDDEYSVYEKCRIAGSAPPRVYTSWAGWENAWAPVSPDNALLRVKVYTERTGWAVEKMSVNDHFTAIVPGQNLPTGVDKRRSLEALDRHSLFANIPTPEYPTFLRANGNAVEADLPRLSLLDQVYPPVAHQTVDANGQINDRGSDQIMQELYARRYSWIAVQQRTANYADAKSMLVRVLITYRADLQNKYIRQMSTDTAGGTYNVQFDLTDHITSLTLPRWDDPSSDLSYSVFPRPWLVIINKINLQDGLIGCSNEVAALLPPDSYFVVAARNGTLFEGTTFKITSREFNDERTPQPTTSHNWVQTGLDITDSALWATLRINPTGGTNSVRNVLAWVVPPAFGSDRFADQTPVVGVRVGEVEIQ